MDAAEERIEGADLFWLQEGTNSIGSHRRSVVLLPAEAAPAFVGELCLHGGEVTIGAAGEELRLNGGPAEPRPLHADDSSTPDRLSVGRLDLRIVRRGARVGVIVHDPAPFAAAPPSEQEG